MKTIALFVVLIFASQASVASETGLLWETPASPENGSWYFQSLLASSSETDFHDAVSTFDFERSEEHSYLGALSIGKKISDYFLVWPFEVVAYASLQHFNERRYQANAWGVTWYAKAYHSFNISFTDFPVRLGFGHGLSYVSRIPASEARDFLPHQSEKLIYYMDYSLQTSLRHLIGYGEKPLSSTIDDVYFGYSVWHRSTVFGLLGESTGGINYQGFSVETVFK